MEKGMKVVFVCDGAAQRRAHRLFTLHSYSQHNQRGSCFFCTEFSTSSYFMSILVNISIASTAFDNVVRGLLWSATYLPRGMFTCSST